MILNRAPSKSAIDESRASGARRVRPSSDHLVKPVGNRGARPPPAAFGLPLKRVDTWTTITEMIPMYAEEDWASSSYKVVKG